MRAAVLVTALLATFAAFLGPFFLAQAWDLLASAWMIAICIWAIGDLIAGAIVSVCIAVWAEQ